MPPQNKLDDVVKGFEAEHSATGGLDAAIAEIDDTHTPSASSPNFASRPTIRPPSTWSNVKNYAKGAVSEAYEGAKNLSSDVYKQSVATDKSSSRSEGSALDSILGTNLSSFVTGFPEMMIEGTVEGHKRQAERTTAARDAMFARPSASTIGTWATEVPYNFPVVGPALRDWLDVYQSSPWRAVGQLGMMALTGKVTGAVGDTVKGAMSGATPLPGEATVPAAREPFQRATYPSGATVSQEAALNEMFDRSAKYIAPEAKGQFSWWDRHVNNRTGLERSVRMADAAQEKLWNTHVEPAMKQFGSVLRSTDQVADAITGSFNDVDRATVNGRRAINAGNELAKTFKNKTMTLEQVHDWIRQLNNEKAVSRFHMMTPEEQTAAVISDPSLRSKIVLARSLRNTLFDAIDDLGGDALGQQFREARKDWGALEAMKSMLREDIKSPTPLPFSTRAASTIRSLWSPKSAIETLGGSRNPNVLVARSFHELGRTGMEPTPLPPRPVEAPQVGLPQGQPDLFSGGAQGMRVTPTQGNVFATPGTGPTQPSFPMQFQHPQEIPPTPNGGVQLEGLMPAAVPPDATAMRMNPTQGNVFTEPGAGAQPLAAPPPVRAPWEVPGPSTGVQTNLPTPPIQPGMQPHITGEPTLGKIPYTPPPVHAPGEAAPTPRGGVQQPLAPVPNSFVPNQPNAQGDIFATRQTSPNLPPPPLVIEQPVSTLDSITADMRVQQIRDQIAMMGDKTSPKVRAEWQAKLEQALAEKGLLERRWLQGPSGAATLPEGVERRAGGGGRAGSATASASTSGPAIPGHIQAAVDAVGLPEIDVIGKPTVKVGSDGTVDIDSHLGEHLPPMFEGGPKRRVSISFKAGEKITAEAIRAKMIQKALDNGLDPSKVLF